MIYLDVTYPSAEGPDRGLDGIICVNADESGVVATGSGFNLNSRVRDLGFRTRNENWAADFIMRMRSLRWKDVNCRIRREDD